jgi:hypothetical protein
VANPDAWNFKLTAQGNLAPTILDVFANDTGSINSANLTSYGPPSGKLVWNDTQSYYVFSVTGYRSVLVCLLALHRGDLHCAGGTSAAITMFVCTACIQCRHVMGAACRPNGSGEIDGQLHCHTCAKLARPLNATDRVCRIILVTGPCVICVQYAVCTRIYIPVVGPNTPGLSAMDSITL